MGALMKRKELLRNLMAPPPAGQDGADGTDGAPSPAPPPSRPRMTKGAVGAVGRSIADLKARSILEIDPFEIEAGGVRDRLEHDDEDHARLMESLREYGQQVPVLVRPHPEPGKEGRYQIVYGRRRVLAMRDLGLPVKALVRDLDDRSLVLAQGQENTARRDLSFIEKANFARQMSEAGYDRKIICDALSIDKTVISRMLQIMDRVPFALVEEIGSAPSVGRDRWSFFADLWDQAPPDADDVIAILNLSDARNSDERFEAVLDWLGSRQKRVEVAATARDPRSREVVRGDDGERLAEIGRSRGTLTMRMKTRDLDGFDDWLAENLAEIHRDWLARRGG
jgi:ParB family chromosome partitioning protein